MRKKLNLLERFCSKVNKSNESGCWLWLGCKHPKGYGWFSMKPNPSVYAHRISWKIYNGEIPKGLHVLHKCDNRICVNPNHLYLGTNDDNIRDKMERNRQSKGIERPASKLNDEKVLEIRSLYSKGNVTQQQLANEFNVANSQINLVINHKAWKHVI